MLVMFLCQGKRLGKVNPRSALSLDILNQSGNHNNLDYDSEPERTLFRRRREARRERQAALEQQFNMAANHNDIPIHEEQNQRVILGQYSQPTSEGCGSTILRPTIQANNFELKPSLIQLVQQDQCSGS
ncbi:hypothetical protein PIB30_102017 [Stylosanthes scabra]|uniref:Uncharacterized protein n=1 Tax=Stylosanthes scabra TaxID=79078 RepID=A0ABU6SXV8_9FABA|nr:hypothetical protein [Stylosanthes scabra]